MIQVLTQEEGLDRFTALDHAAGEHLNQSKQHLTEAFLALDEIREHSLYTYGGFEDWASYCEGFIDQYGVSRSLMYENLAIVRKAKRAGILAPEIREFSLPTLKPWFETGGPIQSYDRYTGEVKALDKDVLNALPEGSDLSSRYGALVREKATEQEPASLVRRTVQDIMNVQTYTFYPFYRDGVRVGIKCIVDARDRFDEYFIFISGNFPQNVYDMIDKALKIQEQQ